MEERRGVMIEGLEEFRWSGEWSYGEECDQMHLCFGREKEFIFRGSKLSELTTWLFRLKPSSAFPTWQGFITRLLGLFQFLSRDALCFLSSPNSCHPCIIPDEY